MGFKNKVSLIMNFIKGSKRYFIAAVMFVSLASLFDLINPKIIGFIVDSIIGNKPSSMSFISVSYFKSHFYMLALIIIFIALIGALFRYLFNLTNSIGAERFTENMRNKLFFHIQHLPFSWYSKNSTGDIIQRCTSDVETIKRFLSEQLTGMFRIIVMLILSLYFMTQISILLTVAAGVFVPVIVLYSLFFHNKIGKTFEIADQQEGKLSSITQENLTGVRVVRAFGREKYEKERFEKQNDIYTNAYMKLSVILSAFWAMGDGISGLQVMTVVILGAVFVIKGSLTAGSYIAFISYNAMLVWPVRRLGRVISEMSRAGVSIERILSIMNSSLESDQLHPIKPSLFEDISFHHVYFKYAPDLPYVLKDINFTIKKGSTVGILGGTGSGKSTLMYLLDALYLPSQGSITIGGYDLSTIDRSYLRENIGMVLQEPYLFSRTIEENIRIAKREASIEDVRKASRIAYLDEAVHHFYQGYHTYVGERGVTLSGGQKQRAAIAQMIIRESPIMIFDDSLSAIDSETDKKIREALETKMDNATVILISHRISTLKNADQIIVLNHGVIKQMGNHKQLSKENGIYQQICNIQEGHYE